MYVFYTKYVSLWVWWCSELFLIWLMTDIILEVSRLNVFLKDLSVVFGLEYTEFKLPYKEYKWTLVK